MSHLVTEIKKLSTSTTEFWNNGIIFIKIKDGAEISLEDSKDQYEFLLSRFDGKNKHLILVEPGRYTTISKEAREFSTKPESNGMTLATAVVVKSLAQRLVINFIISFTRQQTMKMKMFDNKNKAIEWLLNFKK